MYISSKPYATLVIDWLPKRFFRLKRGVSPTEVKIIYSFDTNTIPKLDAVLLREYRLYLADLDLKEKLKILKLKNFQNLKYRDRYSKIRFVFLLLVRTSDADIFNSCMYGFLIKNAHRFRHPIQFSGKLGFFEVDKSILNLH
jgi:hypothetical protein